MNKFYQLIYIIITFCFFSCSSVNQTENVPPPAPVLPLPTAAQMEWHEMEMNAFIHFTTNTFTDMECGFGMKIPKFLILVNWT
jgi:alpha-L-fucosidase